ncbi:MAG: hypothetical protein QOG28_6884 [Trebonia sp.]|nr:hypothetical protein [Trebonia sp.]
MLSPQASGQGWLRYAWLLPAVLATAAICLLCWGAWVYGYDPRWLSGSPAWWHPILQTDQDWTLVVTLALLLGGLGAYWWPRRRAPQFPIGLIVVVVLVLVAAILGTVSYLPCRGQVSRTGIMFWILQLYVGQPPNIYQNVQAGAACAGAPPLALQLGQIDGLGATLIGALAVASVLWRQPLDRLQSRFAFDVTIFTGLTPLTIPLLKQLTETARSPRAIIVIEPDEGNPLLKEARLTGARVVIGDPASPHILRPIISAVRGCALGHLYALSNKVTENEAVIDEAARILSRYQPDPDRQPHLVALIDDPRHADHWRGIRSGRSGGWFEDALSSAESTARGLVSQVLRTQPRQLLVCGDSTLTLAILLELARRAWEQSELVNAAATGLTVEPDVAPPPDTPSPLPLDRVALLDLRSPDIRREYLASAPGAVLDSLPKVVAHPVRWRDHLLRTLDAMDLAQARETAVIITESPPGSGVHEAGRVARLHPETPVFALAPSGDVMGGAIFDLLHPFEPGLLIEGEVPEDTWTRVARHWHECYRLSHPLAPGHPKASARVPWSELDPFLRQDNILELRSILSAVAARGRQWAPVHLVPPGSVIELSEEDLTAITIAEHTRWLHRRLAVGQAGENVVPWEDLPPRMRSDVSKHLCSQLMQLEDVGFLPIVPAGGPPAAARFERVGLVRASQLTEPLAWTNHAGEQMHGYAGDWRVIDDAGNLRTVSDPDFQSSHEPAGDGRWRRVRSFLAWQVSEAVVIRTKEGKATTRPGDWVVEAPTGERWPVRDAQFRWSYRPCRGAPDLPAPPDQASTAATASSSAAPTISS